MSFVALYGFQTSLTAATAAGAGLLQIDPNVAAALAAQLGSSTSFASLSDGVNYEIVKIIAVNSPNMVVVQRAQDGTATFDFPEGACLRFEWTQEGIAAVSSGTPPSIVGTGAVTAIYDAVLNQYTVGVPDTLVSGTLPIQVLGSFPEYEISFQGSYGGCCGCSGGGGGSGPITITGTGLADVTGTDPTFNVDVPAPNFLGTNGVTITGVYPNLTFTGPGVIPPSGVVSVTGSSKILVSGSVSNPVINLVPTGVGNITYNGLTIDNWGTITAVNSGYVPFTTLTSTTTALTITPAAGTATFNISYASTSVPGLVQLAPPTAGGSNNPADSTSAVTPAGLNAALAAFNNVSVSGTFSYTPEVAGNYTNLLASTVTVPVMAAGDTFIVTATVSVYDSALAAGASPLWGIALFHGLTLLQGVQSITTGTNTIVYTIAGPQASFPITLKTTTLSGTTIVPAQSVIGILVPA